MPLPAVLAWVLAVILGTQDAQANGRFPASSQVVLGPGTCGVIAVRTTFGIVVSMDHGHDWTWVCEGAYDAAGSYDPPLALSDDGTMLLGLPGEGTAVGVLESSTLCDWTHPAGDPGNQVYDIAWDATGSTIALGVVTFDAATLTETDGLSVSTDGGHSFVQGARLPNFYLETVEVAPSDPRRMYVSGYLPGGIPELYRSDDGGMSLQLVTMDFTDPNVEGVFVSGVDPTNPNTVYIRANVLEGTRLIRSIDGGMSFTVLTSTNSYMTGFALSDDGQTIWAGSEDRTEGITRSVAGGPFVRVRADTEVQCLRFHDGLLYVCGDDGIDGYALAWSSDGGDSFEPLMSVRDVEGPLPGCGMGTAEHDVCAALWPAQQMVLENIDAATEATHEFFDACDFDGPVEPDVAMLDAGQPMDAMAVADARAIITPAAPGCGCHVADRGQSRRDAGITVGALCVLLGSRRRGGLRGARKVDLHWMRGAYTPWAPTLRWLFRHINRRQCVDTPTPKARLSTP